MRLPTIQGLIERWILLNYRVDPVVLAGLLPGPFRPQLVRGFGVAGICLIRLRDIRPWFLPAVTGIRSENAAHRFAVEWRQPSGSQVGVYIPRRDTSSRLNVMAGGRLFPGLHQHAEFKCDEAESHYRIEINSRDRQMRLRLDAKLATEFAPSPLFTSLEEASMFFQNGSLGYSPTTTPGVWEGLELETLRWQMEPLEVAAVESSFFADRSQFPEGSIQFDSAFLMRHIEHQWHTRPAIHRHVHARP